MDQSAEVNDVDIHLERRLYTETFRRDQIIIDVVGVVTGWSGMPYVILEHVARSIYDVIVLGVQQSFKLVPGTNYLTLPHVFNDDVHVTYDPEITHVSVSIHDSSTSLIRGRITSWRPSTFRFPKEEPVSAIGELTVQLRAVRTKLTQPPDAYRFTASDGRLAFVKPNERIMVGPQGRGERDLRTAFNKRVIGQIWPSAEAVGDLCYCESDQGFYMWIGTTWWLFGRRG